MGNAARRTLIGLVIIAATACTRQVDGVAELPFGETPGPRVVPAVDAGAVMLDQPRMRSITGSADLSIIPSMDDDRPVDIDLLAKDAPEACRFMFSDTAVFGTEIAGFHKTTYQAPSVSAMISQGAAVYRDAPSAHGALDNLAVRAGECAQTTFGQVFVGSVVADGNALRIRPSGDCGRDYRLKSVVLAEVTFCAFPDSVPDIVMTNLLNRIPG